MFGNTFLTSKYLKKMQQGGGISLPEPARFRTPIQGINPAVLQYDINTKPVDVSPLLQVMQTKDSMDSAREKAALEREKLKAQSDLEDKKLQHAQMKMNMEMMSDMFKVTKDASMGASGNPLYVGNDLMTSARFSPKYKEWQDKETQIVTQLTQASSAPIGPQTSTIMMNKMLELQRHRQNAPTSMQMSADHKSMENFYTIMSGTSKEKDLKMNATLANKVLKQREAFLNGEDNGYQLGVTPNSMPGLVYNEAAERKKLTEIYTDINKPIEQEAVDSNGKIITTKTTKKTLDPRLASQAIAERAWADSGLRSYMSDMYGIDLWDVSPNNEASVKELLRDRIQKTIEYDDALYNSTSGVQTNVSTQILPSASKDVNMNYNIKGGTTSTKDVKVDIKNDFTKTVVGADGKQVSALDKYQVSKSGDKFDISNDPALLKAAENITKTKRIALKTDKLTKSQLEAIIDEAEKSSGATTTSTPPPATKQDSKTKQKQVTIETPSSEAELFPYGRNTVEVRTKQEKDKWAGKYY